MDLSDAAAVLGWLFACYGALISVILVHELGHLTVGLGLGFRLVRIRVGPFRYSKADGWKFNWNGIITGVVFLRGDGRSMSGTWWRLSLVLLSGPIANALSAVLVGLILERAGQQSIIEGLFIAGSFVLGVANLWPFRKRGVESDGYQFWGLVFSRKRRALATTRLTLVANMEEFKAAYASGRFDVASVKLEEIIHACTVLPGLSKETQGRDVLINLQSRIQAALAGQAEQLKELPVMTEL